MCRYRCFEYKCCHVKLARVSTCRGQFRAAIPISNAPYTTSSSTVRCRKAGMDLIIKVPSFCNWCQQKLDYDALFDDRTQRLLMVQRNVSEKRDAINEMKVNQVSRHLPSLKTSKMAIEMVILKWERLLLSAEEQKILVARRSELYEAQEELLHIMNEIEAAERTLDRRLSMQPVPRPRSSREVQERRPSPLRQELEVKTAFPPRRPAVHILHSVPAGERAAKLVTAEHKAIECGESATTSTRKDSCMPVAAANIPHATLAAMLNWTKPRSKDGRQALLPHVAKAAAGQSRPSSRRTDTACLDIHPKTVTEPPNSAKCSEPISSTHMTPSKETHTANAPTATSLAAPASLPTSMPASDGTPQTNSSPLKHLWGGRKLEDQRFLRRPIQRRKWRTEAWNEGVDPNLACARLFFVKEVEKRTLSAKEARRIVRAFWNEEVRGLCV